MVALRLPGLTCSGRNSNPSNGGSGKTAFLLFTLFVSRHCLVLVGQYALEGHGRVLGVCPG